MVDVSAVKNTGLQKYYRRDTKLNGGNIGNPDSYSEGSVLKTSFFRRLAVLNGVFCGLPCYVQAHGQTAS